MKLHEMDFKRRFSVNFYKNLTLKLGEMSFSKDFVKEKKRGDLYPVLEAAPNSYEEIRNHTWHTTGKITRLLGQHFPYATYEMTIEKLNGFAGFTFTSPTARIEIGLKQTKNGLCACCVNGDEQIIPAGIRFTPGLGLLVTARCGNFDVYLRKSDGLSLLCTFTAGNFADTGYRRVFIRTTAAVTLNSASVSDVRFYLDCGISQADIRPIRYENGEVMVEQGKIWLTLSVRMEAGGWQGVVSWIPGTCEFELTGALFYDSGDDLWGSDVAASILYHREKKQWYIWVCMFSRGHYLGHAVADGDVRFGVNVIDITLMKKMPDVPDDTLFLGKRGDEDPDFFYDKDTGLWRMCICRVASEGNAYRYFFFESENPFDGYRLVGHTLSGAETGGSFVKIEGDVYFVTGNDFSKRADYRIYKWGTFDSFEKLHCDYDDGGFRGWGTVIPVKMGTRLRYFWLTFDRHNGSSYNWSYGNLYCYEADDYKVIENA